MLGVTYLLYATLLTLARFFIWLGVFRLKIDNQPDFPAGPTILAINHASNTDATFVSAALPKRHVHYMTTSNYFRNPIIAKLIRSAGSFPIKCDSSDRGSLDHASELLKANKTVGIFVISHRSKRSPIATARKGASYISVRSQTNPLIIPIGLRCRQVSSRPPFLRMELTFGEPFRPDQYRNDIEMINNEITNRLQNIRHKPPD